MQVGLRVARNRARWHVVAWFAGIPALLSHDRVPRQGVHAWLDALPAQCVDIGIAAHGHETPGDGV